MRSRDRVARPAEDGFGPVPDRRARGSYRGAFFLGGHPPVLSPAPTHAHTPEMPAARLMRRLRLRRRVLVPIRGCSSIVALRHL